MDSPLYWAVVGLVTTLVAGLIGFGAVDGTTADVARVLVCVFLVFFEVAFLLESARADRLAADSSEDDAPGEAYDALAGRAVLAELGEGMMASGVGAEDRAGAASRLG